MDVLRFPLHLDLNVLAGHAEPCHWVSAAATAVRVDHLESKLSELLETNKKIYGVGQSLVYKGILTNIAECSANEGGMLVCVALRSV